MAYRIVTDVEDRPGERFLYDFNDDRECRECEGVGIWRKPCETCGGSGRVEIPDPDGDGDPIEDACAKCEGKGEVVDRRCEECKATGRLPVYFWIRVLENTPERRIRQKYVDKHRRRVQAEDPKADVSRIAEPHPDDVPDMSIEIWSWVWVATENWYVDAGGERTLKALRLRLVAPELEQVFLADEHVAKLKPLILATDRTLTDFLEEIRVELYSRARARRRGDLRNLARGLRSA